MLKKFLYIVIPIFVFILAIFVEIPVSFLSNFRTYSTPLFISITVGFILCMSLPKKYIGLATSMFTMLLFGLALNYKWSSGYSDVRMIGGLLPIKDGLYYSTGAEFLLNGNFLQTLNYQAGWRPLFPGLLSVLLMITGDNLAASIAILVGLAGFSIYLASAPVYAQFGKYPTALFLSLLYVYILPFLGTVSTEIAGFLLGNLAFVIFWQAIKKKTYCLFLYGVAVLMLAVSIRAGTFFIFPMLALWAGYYFRKNHSFSYKYFFGTLASVIMIFVGCNLIYPRLVSPAVRSNGNFAYTLYGQVRGGIGWYQAREEIGIDIDSVLQASFNKFFEQPLGLIIGSLKAYRDFFSPGQDGAFSFSSNGGRNYLDYLFWFLSILLLILGSVRSIIKRSSPIHLFFSAALLGFLASIPFLPPIDGGNRFYASTIAFFFIFVVFGIAYFSKEKSSPQGDFDFSFSTSMGISLMLCVFTICISILFPRMGLEPQYTAPSCSEGLTPFVTEMHSGSFIDLVPENSEDCGLIPNICLNDFESYGFDRPNDLFYEELVQIANSSDRPTRIFPSYNLINNQIAYFIGDSDSLNLLENDNLIIGCANVWSNQQSIYGIQTITNP